VAVAQIHQDRGGLADQQVAVPEKRRREGRVFDAASFHQVHHRRHARPVVFRIAHDIDIIRTRLFQGQPDELAAPLDLGPVKQFVSHATLRC
jgi:hypothetical protein